MDDVAFVKGHVASAQPKHLPGIAQAIGQLLAAGSARGRAYAVEDRGYSVRITHAEGTLYVHLPTIIRGRLVANILEFVHVELEHPIEAIEVPVLGRLTDDRT
jgi:hypothetical protein